MPTVPVFDAHADSLQRALDLGHDLAEQGPGHLDLARGAEGGLAALVFVCWVDPSYIDSPGGAFARTRDLLGAFHELSGRRPDRLQWAGNEALLDSARATGVLAGVPGIEGGHSIEEDLEKLDFFFDHGVRVMTLVWNNHLRWIRSCRPLPGGADGSGQIGPGEFEADEIPEGLSDFGRDVVRRMNRLGMVVDVSHAGRQAFDDVLATTDRPVIASHSGCAALHAHPRNLDDDQLRALARNGGVVGIVFCTSFLDADAQAEDARVRSLEAYKGIAGAGPADTAAFLAQSQLLQSEARPLPAQVVVEHVLHAVEVAGIDHVGLGSDYDGIERTPQGLEDASRYQHVAELLRQRGLSDEDVERVLYGNMKRVFAQATGPGTRAFEAGLQPLETTKN